jgi:hypothetical protein
MACPEAGDSPNPTLDSDAMVRFSGSAGRSMMGRPSGVFSMNPAQVRKTRACAAFGSSSDKRRAMLPCRTVE